MTDFSIHNCKSICVNMYMPDNANCIRLLITHESSGLTHDDRYSSVITRSEITLFDLPTEVTDILLEHFGNPNEEEEAA